MLSTLLGVLIVWEVQALFTLASSYLPFGADDTTLSVAGHLVAGLACGAGIARVNRLAPLAAALWVIPCWMLSGFVAVALTAVTAALDPASAPASAQISLTRVVPDLLAITGIVVGAMTIVVRQQLRTAPGSRSLP